MAGAARSYRPARCSNAARRARGEILYEELKKAGNLIARVCGPILPLFLVSSLPFLSSSRPARIASEFFSSGVFGTKYRRPFFSLLADFTRRSLLPFFIKADLREIDKLYSASIKLLSPKKKEKQKVRRIIRKIVEQ